MSAQLALTVDPLADCIAWKHDNPEAFEFFLEVALSDVRIGMHPSADFCGHMVRRSGLLARKDGEPVVFNDRLTSGLARLCKREYGIPFSTRKARADEWSQP